MKFRLGAAMAALALSSSQLLCSTVHAELTVGFVTSMSGPNASLGVLYSRGMRTAVATMAEVAGIPVRLVELDDASDPSAAARNARKLIDSDKVDVLIGASGIPASMALAAASYEQKVPFIAVSPISVSGERGSWLVVVPQPLDLMMAADAAHMKKQGVKTVGYIGYTDALGDLVLASFTKAAEPLGIKVIANERFARTDTSVTAQVLRILAARPDAVLTAGSGAQGALPHITLAQRGYKGPAYSTHGIINPDFIRIGSSSVDGVIAPTGPVIVAEQLPDEHPTKKAALQFRAAYQKTVGEPPTDAYSAYSFDAFLIFADAAKRASAKARPGTPEFRDALRDALFEVRELAGTHGVYTFRTGQTFGVDERARVVVRLDKGKWELLK
jgi:branched-chain amino acid transport system substrate-binding protein